MLKPHIRVDTKELRKELRKIDEPSMTAELKDTNKRAADIVIAAALPNVPVRTGRLKASVRSGGGLSGATVRAGTVKVPYAAAIHWGRKKRGVIVGRPFIYNAVQATREQVIDQYKKDINSLLRKMKG